MTRLRGQPPGRAGRLWLRRRMGAASRAASLLDRRLRILHREQARYDRQVGETTRHWAEALGTAETWALRSALLGGANALAPTGDGSSTDVQVEWATVMGARFPRAARTRLPEPGVRGPVPATSAVDSATVAYREALELAVEAAVAHGAARVVASEVAVTRLRKRAIQDRWLPRLKAAAAELDLALDEAEAGDSALRRLRAPTGSLLGRRTRHEEVRP